MANYVYIDNHLGTRPIGKIETRHVQDFIGALAKTPVSRSGNGKATHPMSAASINYIYATLGQIFRLAIASRIVFWTPCNTLVRLPKRPQKRERYLDVQEAAEIIANVPDELRLPVFLAGALGLRRGEVAGLLWRNINRQKRSIQIAQQLNSRGELAPLKRNSTRTLYVPAAFMDYIDQHGDLDNEFVCTYGGKPWSANKIWKKWRPWADKHGLSEWTYHDLRHLAAGLIAHATGGDVLAIKSVLGHDSVDMTLVYTAREAANTRTAFANLEVLTRGEKMSKYDN